jgi:CubicO group peptidase (beta-lactamase class C family)
MTALELTTQWPVTHVAAAVVAGDEVVSTVGDVDQVQRLASISKPIATWAVLVAVEEGVVALDTPVGQDGCTLEHLLAHAGGYPFEGREPIARPGRTRIYSNTGFELVSELVERATEMAFADYLHEAVFAPLGMNASTLIGSAGHGVHGNVSDLCAFVAETRRPTLVSPSTAALATRVHYPDLAGIVPGVGRYAPCPWGLGFEIRGDKQPHWTGARNSARTFGHFGGAGTMFWIDPDADLALIALTDRDFGDWALAAWPELSDGALAEFADSHHDPARGGAS